MENIEIQQVENTDIQQIDIIELVGDLNGKSMTMSMIEEKYGIKDGKRKRLLKSEGYAYNNKSGKWELTSDTTDSDKVEEVKTTYRIPVELHQAVKLQAIFENVNATDIIVKALNGYIPQTTKDIVEQNKK